LLPSAMSVVEMQVARVNDDGGDDAETEGEIES
jgi:hypothetical protein